MLGGPVRSPNDSLFPLRRPASWSKEASVDPCRSSRYSDELEIYRPIIQATDIRFTLYPVGFIISAVFLAATLAAGWLLPASHHVLHWRCQTHHVACLMLGDILMAIIQLAGDSLHGISCKAVGECSRYYCL